MQDTSLHPTITKRLRQEKPAWSWNDCRKAILAGRVLLDGNMIMDPVARVSVESKIEITDRPREIGSFAAVRMSMKKKVNK